MRVEINNVEDARRELANLGEELQTKAIRNALRYASRPIVQRMKDLAPKDQGDLERSINVTVVPARRVERLGGALRGTQMSPDDVNLIVGPNRGGALSKYYSLSHLLEFGTRPHEIRARNSRTRIRFGRRVVSGVINHPGIRPQPFMAPSIDAAGRFQSDFEEGLSRYLTRLAR